MTGRLRKVGENPFEEADRRALDSLTRKIDDLIRRLEHTGTGNSVVPSQDLCECEEPSAFRFDANPLPPRTGRTSSAPLPDPRLLRRIISQRQMRAQFFPADLFSDPAWDILLDLAAAHAEHKRVSVTSLCIASGVPSTTALRWIRVLTEAGLLVRLDDTTDRRRAFIALSDRGARLMARYFAQFGPDLVCAV